MSQSIDSARYFVAEGVILGRQVSLGAFCAILANDTLGGPPTRIADRVVVGANATICGGCAVGEGALVQSGAVVTQDVPENAIVSGNPAIVTGYRNAPEMPATTGVLDVGIGASTDGSASWGWASAISSGCRASPICAEV